jgi:Mg-chelatase subunit ChlD
MLVDGSPDTGWRSSTAYLPQDLVFAFKDDLPALIDRVEIALSSVRPAYRPKRILISTSNDALFSFDDVGELAVSEADKVATLVIGREARYIRVRILESGGRSSGISEVRILEGTRKGYQPSLLRAALASQEQDRRSPAAVPSPSSAAAVEQESNDEPARATPLPAGTIVSGEIEPVGDRDHFGIQLSDEPRQVLTLEMTSEPYIRTSVALLDATGAQTHNFDPGNHTSTSVRLSWSVTGGGPRVLRVSKPPVSIVLIWDTSGSMEGRWEALQEAVLRYLSQVRPTEQLNLIRFSQDVEVLLPEFTSDPERLVAAAKGKFRPMLSTALFDALAKGFQLLEGRSGNRAIILMSDGEDAGSRLLLQELWSILQKSPARVYTIGLGPTLKGYSNYMGTTGERFLDHLSRATGGRAFSTRTPEDLAGLYERIATELRATTRYTLRARATTAAGRLRIDSVGERIPALSAPARVALVLDASGSMRRRVGNRRMIDIAKDVLADLIRTLPENVRIGLRVYGHRVREGRPDDCRDSQLVFPFGPLNRTRLLGQLERVDALGTTPLAYSLSEIGRDLGRERGETMVVVVTDGREECGGDVEAAVAGLQAAGHQVRVNIVGFALTDKPAQSQMRSVAALTGGRYFDARDAQTLSGALEEALRASFRVLDSADVSIADGQVAGAPIAVPEGSFDVVIDVAGGALTVPVRIEADRETRIELRKQGQQIAVQVRQP